MTGNNTINYHYEYRTARIKRQFPCVAYHRTPFNAIRSIHDPSRKAFPFLCFSMRKCSDNLPFINRNVVQVQLLNAIFLVHRFEIAVKNFSLRLLALVGKKPFKNSSVRHRSHHSSPPFSYPCCCWVEPNRTTWENVAATRGANCMSIQLVLVGKGC